MDKMMFDIERKLRDLKSPYRRMVMPQASDEQRDLMYKWFGDHIYEQGPYDFLRSHGYTERAGILIPPTPSHTVSKDEWECIAFLCDEWDFGFDPLLTGGK